MGWDAVRRGTLEALLANDAEAALRNPITNHVECSHVIVWVRRRLILVGWWCVAVWAPAWLLSPFVLAPPSPSEAIVKCDVDCGCVRHFAPRPVLVSLITRDACQAPARSAGKGYITLIIYTARPATHRRGRTPDAQTGLHRRQYYRRG